MGSGKGAFNHLLWEVCLKFHVLLNFDIYLNSLPSIIMPFCSNSAN